MSTHTPRILIVDDTPNNITLLFEYLEEAGFDLFTAESGEKALDVVQEVHPDLILLDVMMPGIDGFETCRRLKREKATQDIPVIFMTVLTSEIDKVKGFLAGGVDYITKPLNHEDVLVHISAHLKIRQLQQELQRQYTRLKKQRRLLSTKSHQLQQIHTQEELVLSYLTHDMQSPLNELLGFARLIDKDEGRHRSEEEVKQNITRTRNAAEIVTILHDNLVTWLQVQQRTLPCNPQSIRIDDIAAYYLVFFTPYARLKGIGLHSRIQEDAHIYADERMAHIVVRNLFVHALGITEREGTVTVSVSTEQEQVYLAVSVTGVRLSSKTRTRLSFPAPAADYHAGGPLEDVDLSLLLSKALVKKNKGRMWIERQSGAKILYHVAFPFRQEA